MHWPDLVWDSLGQSCKSAKQWNQLHCSNNNMQCMPGLCSWYPDTVDSDWVVHISQCQMHKHPILCCMALDLAFWLLQEPVKKTPASLLISERSLIVEQTQTNNASTLITPGCYFYSLPSCYCGLDGQMEARASWLLTCTRHPSSASDLQVIDSNWKRMWSSSLVYEAI